MPSDSAQASKPCPICQEKFEMSWKEDKQDFVWMDAKEINGRVYHASCYADFKKDEDKEPARMATPDSVLGKRKAEVNGHGLPLHCPSSANAYSRSRAVIHLLRKCLRESLTKVPCESPFLPHLILHGLDTRPRHHFPSCHELCIASHLHSW